MNKYNRYIAGGVAAVVALVPLAGVAATPARASRCEQKTFKATAYYSPQEGQEFYVKGSLEDDKVLNGDGTHGASGKPVFNGMIAAPASYPFGTRIFIPGRGIGQIEDRGGAIVQAGERDEQYDRLDVWAGEGQQGLSDAILFGVRFFEAYVCAPQIGGDNVGFDFTAIPDGIFPINSLWEIPLQPGQLSRRVPILKTYLMKLGYLAQQVTSVEFDDFTAKALCTYQVRIMGLPVDSPRCGRFGPQTRASMKAYIQQKVIVFSDSPPEEAGPIAIPEKVSVGVAETNKTTPTTAPKGDWLFGPGGEFATYRFTSVLKVGESSHEVRVLQRKLQRLAYYPEETEISGVYDEATIRAVFNFQLQEGIIEPTGDAQLFGYFGPKTRATLNDI